MRNYAKEQPHDKLDTPFDNATPAYPSLQSQSGVPTVSSVLTFTAGTTVLEISATSGTAGSGGIIGKWGTASVTSSNFDIYVNSGVTRLYVIPISTLGTTSIVGANVANGLFPAIALKDANAVVASVITIEY